MTSPLNVFRHNKKLLTAGLLVMAMVSFVFIGSTGFERAAPDPVLASTKYGYVKVSEMAQFQARTSLANRFIGELVPLLAQALQRDGQLPAESVPMAVQQTLMDFQNRGLIVPFEDNEQAMSEMLWEKKADDLGIEIDDQAVNEFIQRVTLELVPADDIRGLMGAMRTSERSVFYALSQRLKAVRARELLMQNAAMATPDTRLDWYRRTRSKATIEYLPVKVDQFVANVPEPTDSQLRALFDDHKLDIARPDSPVPGFYQVRRSAFNYFTARVEDFLKPEEVTEAEIAAYYEANKSLFPYVAPPATTDTPAEGSATPPPAEESTTPPPAEDGTTPPPAESSETPGAATSETPAEPEAPAPAGDDSNSQTAPEPNTSVDGSAQDAPPAEGAPAPADEAPTEESPAANPPAGGEPAAETPAEPMPAEGATPPAAEAGQPGETPSPDMFAPPTERPKHRPLEEVAGEIRELLAREKARVRIDAQLKQLASRVRFYLTEKAAAASGGAPEPKPLDFDVVAKEFGVSFGRTEMVTAQQLYDTNPLGKAMVEGQGLVAQYAFENMAINQPIRADGDDLQFVLWKIQDKPAYEPKFAEVREQVLEAWRLIEARKLAQARAEQLAEQARKDGRPLAEVFAQTDPPPGVAGPFGWLMRQPFSELTSALPRWMISPVPGVDKPGSEFMRGVFGLSVGETGTAWNAPESTVYVVRMTGITPEDQLLWQEFVAMPFANYEQVAGDDFMRVRQRIYENLRENADLVWQEIENPLQREEPAEPYNNPSALPNF